MSPRVACAIVLAMASALWVPSPARAMDPTFADHDAQNALQEGRYRFCQEPDTPLSSRARDLCPLAQELPECEGFRRACDDLTAPNEHEDDHVSPHTSKYWALPGMLGGAAKALLWGIVLAVVVMLTVPLVRLLRRAAKDRSLADVQAEAPRASQPGPVAPAQPTITDAEALLRRADEHAGRGDGATALQLYLAAALRALDRRGVVRLTKDRTNGEYVRLCSDPAAREPLREIVREVDEVQFGGAPATEGAVRRAAERAAALVHSVVTSTFLVALVLGLASCTPGRRPHAEPASGRDPAGDELLIDLLRRQSATVERLTGSLAVLPMPDGVQPAPAVIVDAERTFLDDTTREHLMEWVNAGGVLVLAGGVEQWPEELGVSRNRRRGDGALAATELSVLYPQQYDDEDEEEPFTYWRGSVIDTDALGAPEPDEDDELVPTWIATFESDHAGYALVFSVGAGRIVGLASDELLTNAALARPGNASVLIAILTHTERNTFQIAPQDSGVAPPTNPLTPMLRIGLGLGLLHALAAVGLLFWCVGVRTSRPRPAPPPARRAFVEHVLATGALYARTELAGHALSAYVRYAEGRIRARLPRGSGDVVGFLASRARVDRARCEALWTRAKAAHAGQAPQGDELTVLREIKALYVAAMAHE